MITQKIDKIRGVHFSEKDLENGKKLHETLAALEEKKNGNGQFVKSFVYGGLDGIVTTFAVVAGVAGANLSSAVVLVLGVANLIADGISMAFGDYLSTKAENEYIDAERDRETQEARINPEEEKQEMVAVYMDKGIPETEAKSVVNILSKYEKPWVDIKMVEEFGLIKSFESPTKNAMVTFGSFILFGSIPVLIYIIARFVPFFAAHTFFTACILTGITLFILGTLKVYFTRQSWYRAGFEMLLLGGFAAVAAYVVGVLLGKLA